MILKTLIALFIPFSIYAQSLSYYKGYLLYKQEIEDATAFSSDFNQILEGMKAAHNGLALSQEEIEERKKEIYHKANEERLTEANRFMAELPSKNEVLELVKGKLAYKITTKGEGAEIEENDSPFILYKAYMLANGKQVEQHAIEEPKTILLKSTIPGFTQGVIGMKEGETRLLYIHPDLAYGSGSALMEPNSQMIFEVTVLKKNAATNDLNHY